MNVSYNAMATVLFVQADDAVQHLFSRGTAGELNYGVLVSMLIIYTIGKWHSTVLYCIVL